ncbi:sensor domain-containing diguanylate cyclase [Vibrio sp. CAU 1672]|uniref:sensor domain-containing diguanylate cyclase n=1 Tax=Vibrio sp. CAU 1672 TaxID=3032594 RepID=UPI0023D9C28B|nr:sensor domain-containing diguanylate cyclase [Vibrio sp. CAU 1672]MDF2155558.1 sensor domain-containing diguanylate cyclase [Vibrio sp. CAU 1672]
MNKDRLLDAHRSVNRLLAKLALGMDRSQLNKKVIMLSEHLFGQRKASILRLHPEHSTLHLEYAPHLPDFYNQAIEGVLIGPETGSCGAAAYLKQTVVVSNINQHRNWAPFLELTRSANLHACWSVPIVATDGNVLGTFAIYSEQPSEPHAYELEVLEMLAALYSVALEKFRLEEQLHFHASRDPLTHCFNRRALLAEVDRKINRDCVRSSVVGCFFVDIDQFKYINDRFGHEAGDQVLVFLAKHLKQLFRSCSVIGRYGGDEFVAFSCFPDLQAYHAFAAQITDELNQICRLEEYYVRASVGAASSTMSERAVLQKLIQQADLAMYRTKRAKRA